VCIKYLFVEVVLSPGGKGNQRRGRIQSTPDDFATEVKNISFGKAYSNVATPRVWKKEVSVEQWDKRAVLVLLEDGKRGHRITIRLIR